MINLGTHEHWVDGAIENLRKEIELLGQCLIAREIGQWQITFSALDQIAPIVNAAIKQAMDRPDRAVYIIELTRPEQPQMIRSLFRKLKKEKSGDRLPLDNINAPDDSLCLYIGSSCSTEKRQQTLAGRIMQHLTRAPQGTYALKLSTWASDIPGDLILRAFQFNDISHSTLLALEDYLSQKHQPLFGRRGKK
jgi:hypothetical protein